MYTLHSTGYLLEKLAWLHEWNVAILTVLKQPQWHIFMTMYAALVHVLPLYIRDSDDYLLKMALPHPSRLSPYGVCNNEQTIVNA